MGDGFLVTTSGTATWNPTFSDIIEEAYERAGVEIRSGYELRTAVRSLQYLFAEWASRGLNLWTLEQETMTVNAGQSQYTMSADAIDAVEMTIQDSSMTQITMERYSVSQWSQIPDKLTSTGRPVAYFIQRLESAPIVNLYPIPDTQYTLVYWQLCRIQDVGSVMNTADMPFRFIPALVAGLAYHVAVKKQQAANRVMPLKQAYDEAWQLAADEDRDRSSFFFTPWCSVW